MDEKGKNYIEIDTQQLEKMKTQEEILKILQEKLQSIISEFNYDQDENENEDQYFIEQANATKKQLKALKEFKIQLRCFCEFSDIFDEGKQKYKEIFVKKQAGGRMNQRSLLYKLSCKTLCGCYDRRYVIITQDGLMYSKGIVYPDSQLKEIILFDYNFQISSGFENTGNNLGIQIKTKSRMFNLIAFDVFDFLDILYALKEAYDHSIYAGVHRFNSFAPPRLNCIAKWYVDGQNYFSDVYDAIDSAKQEVFITGWWVSPEIYLKRPPEKYPESRLDLLIQKKANEGVKFMISVYCEMELALTLNSKYTQSKLQSLHPTNIIVQRHPKYVLPFMWSHHEKTVTVDQEVCFIGGLDMCYGRWDNQQHNLFDKGEKQLFQGIEYNNVRIKDFSNVQNFNESNIDRNTQQRLPWHDIATRIIGPSVKDVSKHFIQYWNFAQIDNENKGGHQGCLIPQERAGQKNPFKPYIKEFNQKLKGFKNKVEGFIKNKIKKIQPEIQHYLDEHDISIDLNKLYKPQIEHQATLKKKTSFEMMLMKEEEQPRAEIIQLLKQLQQIKQDNEHDEFEDNYTDTSSEQVSIVLQQSKDQLDKNAAEKNEFHGTEENEINSKTSLKSRNNSLRFSAYKSMLDKSIETTFGNIQKQIQQTKNTLKLQAKKYKQSKNQSYQKCQILRSASYWSLGLFKQDTETSIQIAYLALINESKHFIYIENQFFISCNAGAPVRNQISKAIVERIKKAAFEQKPFKVIVFIPLLPGFEGEIDQENSAVMKIQLHWEYQTICRGGYSIYEELKSDPNIKNPFDYIQFFGLRNHGYHNNKPYSEIIYIHSKMMIIDDSIVIMGSANINDRSMKGTRDSEIATIIEDQELIQSKMGGNLYMASKYAHTLRCELFKEHFGLEINQVIDPLDQELNNLINKQTQQNTAIYRDVFRCYPDDEVTSISQLEEFRKKANPQNYAEAIKNIKGFAVTWPIHFLENENLKFTISMKEYYCPEIGFT